MSVRPMYSRVGVVVVRSEIAYTFHDEARTKPFWQNVFQSVFDYQLDVNLVVAEILNARCEKDWTYSDEVLAVGVRALEAAFDKKDAVRLAERLE